MEERTELIGATVSMSNVVGYIMYKSTGLIVKFEAKLYFTNKPDRYYLISLDNAAINLVPKVPGAIMADDNVAVLWMEDGTSDEQVIQNFIHYMKKIELSYLNQMKKKVQETNLTIDRLTNALDEFRTRSIEDANDKIRKLTEALEAENEGEET